MMARCALETGPRGRAAPPVSAMRQSLIRLLLAAVLWAPVALARDNIEASPYGMVLSDLLLSFHADEVPCEDGTVEAPEVCFFVSSVGASYLAERLTALVDAYAPAGLSHGEWRAANGVWAVALAFRNAGYGHLEVYLAETLGAGVRGLVRLVNR